MDSDDDWENDALETEEEQKTKEVEEAAAKRAAFDDEDKVDAEAKKKKLEEEAKLKQEQFLKDNQRDAKQGKKVDYDALFAKRQEALTGIKPAEEVKDVDANGKKLSAGAKGMVLEMAAETGLADQLFGGLDDAPVGKLSLNSEKEYKDFGKKTGQLLYQGSAPYRIENFFRELCKDLPDHCDSKQLQKITDHLSIMQKTLAKKEKEARDGKNKKKAKASIAAGGAKGGDDQTRNNNTAMINDVMGVGADDYGDYGNEAGATFTREEEAAYDFM